MRKKTEVCGVTQGGKKVEGNKAGEDLPGSRWLRESLSSPRMEGGGEIRASGGRSGGKEIKGGKEEKGE